MRKTRNGVSPKSESRGTNVDKTIHGNTDIISFVSIFHEIG